MNLRFGYLCILCTILVMGGCADSGPRVTIVRGKVTYRGEPVSQGTIHFAPQESANKEVLRPAVGNLSKDGSFELRAFPGKVGALPGEYAVSVRSYTGTFMDRNVQYLVPEKFADPKTSGLKATVPADSADPHILNFELR